MNAQTACSPRFTLSLLIAILFSSVLFASAGRAQTPAQAAPTISFKDAYFPVSSINQETPVFYESNIIVSPATAELECDPSSGAVFSRGATLVTCTATLGDQTAEGSFYVLVSSSSGDDTDIEIYTIAVLPEEVYQAASFTYNVELRNNGSRRATGIVVSGTLPPQVDFVRADSRCDTEDLPAISCVVPVLLVSQAWAVPIDVKVKSGVTGAIFLTMSAEITAEGEDLFADNNSFTRRVDVRVLGFGNNTVYLPMLRR